MRREYLTNIGTTLQVWAMNETLVTYNHWPNVTNITKFTSKGLFWVANVRYNLDFYIHDIKQITSLDTLTDKISPIVF